MRQLLRSRQKKDSGVGGRKRPRRLSLWSEVRCFLGPYSQRCGHTHLSHIHTGRHVRLADRFFDLDLRASRSVAAHCPSGWWNIPSIPTQYVGANLTTLQVRLRRCSFLHRTCLIEAPLTWFRLLHSSIKPSLPKLMSIN